MKRFFAGGGLLLLLWVTGSAIFKWPPLWHYAGDSLSACINGLREVDGMKEQWAMETKQTNGTPVDPVQLERYFRTDGYRRQMPHCPSGGTYTYGNIGQRPVCSLATNTPPAALKERVGLFGWRWKIPPSRSQSHALPQDLPSE